MNFVNFVNAYFILFSKPSFMETEDLFDVHHVFVKVLFIYYLLLFSLDFFYFFVVYFFIHSPLLHTFYSFWRTTLCYYVYDMNNIFLLGNVLAKIVLRILDR